ncbi:hypothetical protein [Sphingobacterium allocomposti]|nr:hypothetical protein [Sphingobacterium composti Yoo et al. 2007 non Ten et al. 2007]
MSRRTMIGNYFQIQGKALKRHVVDAGFPAFVIVPAYIGLHVALYYLVVRSPSWGAYLVVLANFQSLFLLSDFKRNDFLKVVFSKTDYYRVRLFENILLCLGSMVLLVIAGNPILAVTIGGLCILFLFTPTTSIWKRRIPTPFAKKPFEFIIGVRKTWLLLGVLYLLAAIGLSVDNINLALFSMFCVVLCSASYYQDPEPLLLYWNQNRPPAKFLWYKIRRGVAQLCILWAPILLPFAVLHPAEAYKGVIVCLLGVMLIPYVILLKYAVYPRKINITEGTMLGLCLAFYPLVLALIPYYYFKAIQNLKNIP